MGQMPRPLSLVLPLLLVLTGCGENSTGDDAGDGGAPAAGSGGGGTSGMTATAGAGAGNAGAGGRAASGGKGGTGGTAGGVSTGGAGSGGKAGGTALGGAAGSDASSGGVGGRTTGGASGVSGAGSAGASGAGSGGGGTGGAGGSPGGCGPVTSVPAAVRDELDLDPFYEKYVDANGLAVLGSSAPSDESLLLACQLLKNMLGERDDVRLELIRRKARFAIIGKDEGTADIPEYGYGDATQDEIDYINQRARGLGGQVASCGEENILCLGGDRYPRESICVHEFSHTITTYGAYSAVDGFQDSLDAAYDDAMASGILEDTYRGSDVQEYWAEGVQDWYDTNDWSEPPNGIHNGVNTRTELADYDPALYALVDSLFPAATDWGDCRDE